MSMIEGMGGYDSTNGFILWITVQEKGIDAIHSADKSLMLESSWNCIDSIVKVLDWESVWK